MPDDTRSHERKVLRELCHDMRGALNSLGTALSLCELQAAAQPELKSSVEIALRGYKDSIRLFEQIVQATHVDEDLP